MFASDSRDVVVYTCHSMSRDASNSAIENWNEQFTILERMVTDDKTGAVVKKTYLWGSNLWQGSIEVQPEPVDGLFVYINRVMNVSVTIETKPFERPLSKESNYFGSSRLFFGRLTEPLTSRDLGCFSK